VELAEVLTLPLEGETELEDDLELESELAEP
jgi:hypothetical protein